MEHLECADDGSAGRLRGVSGRLVAMIVADIASPFYAEVNRVTEDRLAEDHCMMLMCGIGLEADQEAQMLTWLQEKRVRGILISPVRDDLTRLRKISARGTPVVLLDRLPGRADLCAVSVDHRAGGLLAGEHLLQLGHRRIAFLGPSPVTVTAVRERRQGLRDAMWDAGLDPERDLVDIRVPAPDLVKAADAAMNTIVTMKDPVTAIACMNDMTALGVLQGLGRHGVHVPEEVSVIGYDDVIFASRLAPALTTIRQPIHQLGHAAAELLIEETEPGHRHRTARFQPQLIVRASTAEAG